MLRRQQWFNCLVLLDANVCLDLSRSIFGVRSSIRSRGDEKESRWRTKKREDRSGRSTTTLDCGKSGRWTARRATKEGRGSTRSQ